MQAQGGIPEWIGTAVLGAVIAALGYVAKLVVEALLGWRRERAARRASLFQLAALLRAARVLFLMQRKHAGRLAGALREKHPELVAKRKGLQLTFTRTYKRFTPREKELHALIRGITEHGLKPLNDAISQWLASDRYFRAGGRGTPHDRALARELNRLDAHLLLWHAKYAAWIPRDERYALIYLADEERHGVGFPRRLNRFVDELLGPMPKETLLADEPRSRGEEPPE